MNYTDKSVLNKQTMRSLIGDDDALREKFEIDFLKQGKQSLRKMTALFNESQFELIQQEAHFLKTSAKAVGAEQVAAILQELETIALSSDGVACKEMIISLNTALKQVYGMVKDGV